MILLKRLYDKSAVLFAVLWIVAYCVLMSVGDMLSDLVGVEKAVTLPIALLLSIALFIFLYKNRLLKNYGFKGPSKPHSAMLFYMPLFLMLGVNLVFGVRLNYSAIGTVLYILTMLAVGFLEEVIFRGLLFESMRKDSQAAIIVSSVTFGIGHIINLINGSGAELLTNLLQVVYATAAGFMFVMIYLRSGSIFPCIIAHGVFNALSAFSADASAEPQVKMISAAVLTLITGGYAIYLALFVKDNEEGVVTKDDVS